jgi:hypothetical protein
MKVKGLKRVNPSLLAGRPDNTHCSDKKVVLIDISLASTKLLCFALVAHVGNMTPTCCQQPTMLAKYCRQGNVATSTYFFLPFPRIFMSENADIS